MRPLKIIQDAVSRVIRPLSFRELDRALQRSEKAYEHADHETVELNHANARARDQWEQAFMEGRRRDGHPD